MAATFMASNAAQYLKSHFQRSSVGGCTGYVRASVLNSTGNGKTFWSCGRAGFGWEMGELLATANWRVIYDGTNVKAKDVVAWCNKNAQVGDCASMTHCTNPWGRKKPGIGHGAMCFENNGSYAHFGADYDHGTAAGPCAWFGGNPTYSRFRILRWNGPININGTIVDGTKGGCFTGGASGGTSGTARSTVTEAPKGKDNYRGTELKVIALQEESDSLSNATADLSALAGLQEEYEAQQSSDSFSIINKMSDFSVAQSDLYT